MSRERRLRQCLKPARDRVRVDGAGAVEPPERGEDLGIEVGRYVDVRSADPLGDGMTTVAGKTREVQLRQEEGTTTVKM